MVTFWNITSDKLNSLEISESDQKIIFVSDTERLYVDFNGIRTEYRDIIYVQNINNIVESDSSKNSIYFDLSAKKLYYYTDDKFILLNPDCEGIVFIGKFTGATVNQENLNTFVQLKKGRTSKINDMVLDAKLNQWLKVDDGTEEDWINLTKKDFATYESMGLVKIKNNSGLKIENGVLSLNLLDSNRDPGQIVILNNEGKIDTDIVKIEWEAI